MLDTKTIIEYFGIAGVIFASLYALMKPALQKYLEKLSDAKAKQLDDSITKRISSAQFTDQILNRAFNEPVSALANRDAENRSLRDTILQLTRESEHNASEREIARAELDKVKLELHAERRRRRHCVEEIKKLRAEIEELNELILSDVKDKTQKK